MLSGTTMSEIKNSPPLPDKSPKPPAMDSAIAVWLKLIGLLVALSAFGLVVYWLTRTIEHH